ncbi:MAG: DUF4174 domain-containing protein [Pseudomonadota bacterium]
MLRTLLFSLALGSAGLGQASDLTPPDLESLKWVARPIIVFAESDRDPRIQQQVEMLAQRQAELDERDVVVIIDTDPDSVLRDTFRPRDFMFVLVGKDGEVKYRKPRPVPVREISRVIDRMPMRRQEMGLE